MSEKVRLGLIGLGGRGTGLLDTVISEHPDVEVAAVCDRYGDRTASAAELLKRKNHPAPFMTADYREILKMPDVDAVFFCTSWDQHINLCIQAMEAGKYTATEVGGSYSVRECWRLVEAYEKTGVPCMLMENCVYGREEMMIRHMAELGVLGKIVHCEGGYKHDLRDEIAFGRENRHYRLNNYIHRNAENYPTHEIGPIARILRINRGNRMLTLTSVASRSEGLREYIKDKKPDDAVLRNTDFRQGDVVNTIITCADGSTILITLDTTLPRYYSRGFTVQGTKGMYCEDNQSIFLDGAEHARDHFNWKKHWGNVEEYRDKYEHPLWREYLKNPPKKKDMAHDDIDWIVFCEFIKNVKAKTEVPIDVYDMASWMSITALSEQSIAMGGQPVPIPDFTCGSWMSRTDPLHC